MSWFFACWYKFGKAQCWFYNYWVGMLKKWVRPFRSYGTLKPGALTNYLMNQPDWLNNFCIGLITNLLCIFDICWVSAAVVLVKNVLFLVPTGKVLELGFPKCFLIKDWFSVERLFPVEKIWEMTKNLGAHPAWLLNPTISKFWHSSYMVVTLHNLKILLSFLLLFHPTISNFYQPANLNFLWVINPT